MEMSSVSGQDQLPGKAQVAMLRKVLDGAQDKMAGLLAAMPQPVPAPGRLDIYM